MAATLSTMSMLNTKCMTMTTKASSSSKPITKLPISLLSIQNLPKGLTTTPQPPQTTTPLLSTAIAGAVFSALSSCDPAFAAQQLTELAESTGSDNRGLALLLPLIPAIAWVLYNILQPALNQINRMRSSKGVVVGLGIGGGLAALAMADSATAAEVAAAGSDNRGQLLLFVVAPAILWVLYNILQPALNQINRMRS